MPNAQVLQPQAPGNIMATGLTPVENALLSDEEKQIRLRQTRFSIMNYLGGLIVSHYRVFIVAGVTI